MTLPNGVLDLEPIYAAFFALLSGSNLPGWTDATGQTKSFAVASRVPRGTAQISAGQLPCLFHEELGFEIAATGGHTARTKYKLRVDVAVIVSCAGAAQPLGQETQIPSQDLNHAITAVLNAVANPNPNGKQTLGGLVDSVVAEGRIERVNGLPGAGTQLSIGVIPYTILTI